jgi:hypothetical protein
MSPRKNSVFARFEQNIKILHKLSLILEMGLGKAKPIESVSTLPSVTVKPRARFFVSTSV